MSIESAIAGLRRDSRLAPHVAVWQELAPRPPRYLPFPPLLDGRLVAALRRRGVETLYSHQAEAVEAALAGQHVAVVTPAASGKTLCYNLPVLQRLLAQPNARALYLYPTKALAQDQLAALGELIDALAPVSGKAAAAPPFTCAAYDGDTPQARRARIRENAAIVLSNPDMLHAGILPQHTRWAGFFANLRLVVIDEMHMYRGVFGSHVADVLRRLRRVCRFYGADPQFIFASATIANPGDLAERLAEAPVTVIGPERNGAPQGERHILLYNPPLVDPALGIRRSSSLEATELAAHFLSHDVQTIVFAGARLTAELIVNYLRNRPEPLPAVAGYRGGYLPHERREIERRLREGTLRGVVATNALELGIDIGQLEAAVLAGYPGSIASAWQQMGRAGRRQGKSLAVLVATPEPIDQYLVTHPEYLFERSPEHALVNPDNPVILANHLACAAAELPLAASDGFGRARDVAAALDFLAGQGELYFANGRYLWAGEGYPAGDLSLRAGRPDRLLVQMPGADGRPQVIGEMDRAGATHLLYPGAIYMHLGETYLVEGLDWEAGAAAVRPVEVDFYTRPSIGEDVEVLAGHAACDYPPGPGASVVASSAAGDAAGDGHGRSALPPVGSPAAVVDGPALGASAPGGAGRDASAGAEPAGAAGPGPAADRSAGEPAARAHFGWGDVRVIGRMSGYRTLRRYTNELLSFTPLEMPEEILETAACWIAFQPGFVEALRAEGAWLSSPNDYGPSWPAQRAAARARDGFRCQACGAAEGNEALPANRREHDVHHKIPLRAFVAHAELRPGLPPELAWQAANRLENLVTLCSACHRRAEAHVRLHSGLGGLSALLAGVAPLYLMCDPRDLGVITEAQAPATGLATITIYEKVPAGVGYAAQLYALMPELLAAAAELLAGCPCEQGCPSCVGPVLDHEYALDAKALTRALLTRLLAG